MRVNSDLMRSIRESLRSQPLSPPRYIMSSEYADDFEMVLIPSDLDRLKSAYGDWNDAKGAAGTHGVR